MYGQNITNRASFTIIKRLVAGASFQWKFPVGFAADEFYVRQITYGGVATDINLSAIQTDLVMAGDGIIAQIYPNTDGTAKVGVPIAMTVSPNSCFPVSLGKINAGTATFYIVTADNQPNTTADGLLMITLEFIQYAKPPMPVPGQPKLTIPDPNKRIQVQ